MALSDGRKEKVVFDTLAEEQRRIDRNTLSATPALSQRVGDIYRKYPAMPAGVILAAAQAGLNDDQVTEIGNQATLAKTQNPDLGKDNRNWFQRNVYDRFKTGTRWAFAGLEFPLQTIQGGAAQVFANNPDGIDGWFISTDLGSMISDDEKAGEGFFIGGEAKQLQTERVRAYRGTTHGGHAWTVGRGLAGTVSTEGSAAYNLMSGLVDGSLALYVPAVPGLKTAATAVKIAAEAEQAGKFIKGADVAFDILRGKGVRIQQSLMTADELKEARRVAGLVGETVDASIANKWFGSASGQRMIQRLAEANTIDAVRKAIGQNIYPETAIALRNAKTAAEVEEALVDILGVAQKGFITTKMPGARKFSVSNARRVKAIDHLVGVFEDSRFGRITERAFANRPMRNIVDFSSENSVDVRRTINDTDNWMKAALVPDDDWEVVVDTATGAKTLVLPGRVKMLDMIADSLIGPNATPTSRKNASEAFKRIIRLSTQERGARPSEVMDAVFNRHFDEAGKLRSYGNPKGGLPYDYGFFNRTAEGEWKLTDGAFGGPQLTSELGDFIVEMPDVRQVRALTGRLNRVYRKTGAGRYGDDNIERLAQAGVLRQPLSAIQFLQDNIFRKTVTATLGFVNRALLEGQLRLALTALDVTSVFRHPLQHMQWAGDRQSVLKALRGKGVGDVMGQDFTQDVAEGAASVYQDAVRGAVLSQVKPDALYRSGVRTGQVSRVRRVADDKKVIALAHGDEIGKLNADWAARQLASGKTEDEVAALAATDPDGQIWFRNAREQYLQGEQVIDRATGQAIGKRSIDLNDPHNLRELIAATNARLRANVGGHADLRYAVSQGRTPRTTVAELSGNRVTSGADIGLDASKNGQVVTIRYPISKRRTRDLEVRVIDGEQGIVEPFAFKKGEVTAPLNDIINNPRVMDDKALAQELSYEVRQGEKVAQRGQMEMFDRILDKYFGFLFAKPTAFLERSALFKQRYYTWVMDEMLTSLSKADIDKLVTNVTEAAARNGVTPSQYVGDNVVFRDMANRLFKGGEQTVGKRWQKVLDLQADPKRLKGTLSLDEIDEFAKGQALDDMKTVVYDASERSNFVDVARAFVPFAGAQIEFLKALGRIYTLESPFLALPNLEAIRKTQLLVENGMEGDGDSNGRGFLFRDPQTGEWSFTYPFSPLLTHLATSALGGGPGIKSTLQAPIKGAFMGLDVRPGFGPFVQVASSVLLQDKPSFDWAKSIFTPYGEADLAGGKGIPGAVLESITPAYLKKLSSAFFDDPESQTVYGNTVFETYQALAASGAYKLNDAASVEQMKEDATTKARFLTVLRAVGQYLGPSRPSNKISVETKQGDVFVNLLAQDLRERELTLGYDEAIPSWLDTYGEDIFVYLSGKTKAVYGGLAASKEFGDFERSNKSLFNRYKEVAGYFAPGGTDLDWQVYTRQLETGARKRITTDEALAAAQRYIGWAQYRQVQKLAGPYPNDAQKDYLRRWKEQLAEKYPGFANAQYDPNELQRRINLLGRALEDDVTTGIAVADAARKYYQTRELAMTEAKSRGLQGIQSAKGAADLREYMRAYGEILKQETPAFARLYDQLLAQEIED